MQMINNKNGVTLISIIITVLVLAILSGVSIKYALKETDEINDKKLSTQLVMVQTAVMQRYTLLNSTGKLGKIAPAINENARLSADTETDRPSGLVGTRIASTTYIDNHGFGDVDLKIVYTIGVSNKKFEEYYYLLSKDDLESLGVNTDQIDDNQQVKYIVNYSTGEVFDIENKQYWQKVDNQPVGIYVQPSNVTIQEKQYDFNDD